jgi:hypothetical protein
MSLNLEPSSLPGKPVEEMTDAEIDAEIKEISPFPKMFHEIALRFFDRHSSDFGNLPAFRRFSQRCRAILRKQPRFSVFEPTTYAFSE